MKNIILICFLLIVCRLNISATRIDSFDIKDYNEMSLEELMNMNIATAGRKFEKISDIPASVVIITRKEIEGYGYQDLKEVINQINGMYVMSNLGVDIYGVRGFAKDYSIGKGNNFIIMVNNVKITDEKILTFYQIPVEIIDRIEVVRGPMAVIYGNNAFFGVINIITNKQERDSNKLITSYGSNNTEKLTVRLSSQEKEELSFVLNLSLFKTKGQNFPLSSMITRPERMDEPLFGGDECLGLALPEEAKSTENYLSSNQKYLNISATFKKFTFNLFYVESKQGWYYYLPSLDKGSSFDNKNLTFSLKYTDSFSEKLSFDASVRYSVTSVFQDYHHLFEGFYGTDRFYYNEVESEINIFWKPKYNLNITVGLQYENMLNFVNDTDVPIANLSNITFYYIDEGDDGITYSSFVQAEYKPIERLRLIAGFRIEQMMDYGLTFLRNYCEQESDSKDLLKISDTRTRNKLDFIPRLALIYKINNNNFIKLLYGKAIKRPTFINSGEDLLDITIGDKTGGYSKSEYIYTRELNILSVISDKIVFNGSMFWNTLKNLIIERNAIENGILRAWMDNVGKMETLGVEASFLIEPNDNIKIEFGGTYQKTEDKTYEVTASYSPRFIGYFKFALNSNNKYFFSLTGNYTGRMKPFYSYFPLINEDGTLSGDVLGWTSRDVPGYAVINTNIRINDFIVKGVYMNINCSNILNTEIYYPTFSINNAWADRGTLGNGRRFLITLGFDF